MITLLVKAEFGNCGSSIDAVQVISDNKLSGKTFTADPAMPSLKDAELESEFVTTESWGYISWEPDYFEDYIEENSPEGADEDPDSFINRYRENHPEPKGEFLGIAFHTSHDSDVEIWRATYKSLEKGLLKCVKNNSYEERIIHKGTKSTATYVYHLSESLFKEA